MQNIYMVRKRYKKVYQRKFTNEIKEAIEKFCLERPVSVTLPEAEHSKRDISQNSTEAFNSSGYINHKIRSKKRRLRRKKRKKKKEEVNH